jgi:hypothetical protein
MRYWKNQSNTVGATCGAEAAYYLEHLSKPPYFSLSIFSFLCNVV